MDQNSECSHSLVGIMGKEGSRLLPSLYVFLQASLCRKLLTPGTQKSLSWWVSPSGSPIPSLGPFYLLRPPLLPFACIFLCSVFLATRHNTEN